VEMRFRLIPEHEGHEQLVKLRRMLCDAKGDTTLADAVHADTGIEASTEGSVGASATHNIREKTAAAEDVASPHSLEEGMGDLHVAANAGCEAAHRSAQTEGDGCSHSIYVHICNRATGVETRAMVRTNDARAASVNAADREVWVQAVRQKHAQEAEWLLQDTEVAIESAQEAAQPPPGRAAPGSEQHSVQIGYRNTSTEQRGSAMVQTNHPGAVGGDGRAREQWLQGTRGELARQQGWAVEDTSVWVEEQEASCAQASSERIAMSSQAVLKGAMDAPAANAKLKSEEPQHATMLLPASEDEEAIHSLAEELGVSLPEAQGTLEELTRTKSQTMAAKLQAKGVSIDQKGARALMDAKERHSLMDGKERHSSLPRSATPSPPLAPPPQPPPPQAPPTPPLAAASSGSLLDRIAVLEEMLFAGQPAASGALGRVAELEAGLFGASSMGPLPGRVRALEEAMGIDLRAVACEADAKAVHTNKR